MVVPFLALVAAVLFSAFTSVEQPAPQVVEDELYWFDPAGNYTGRQATKSEEMVITDCLDETTILCENGYGPEDFNVIGNPQSGLRSSAQVNETITERLP